MACKKFTHKLIVTPANNPETLWQIRSPANNRALLKAIEFMPLGTTPATAPLLFDLGIQAADGTFVDDSSAHVKSPPAFGGNLISTLHITCTLEPSTTAPHYYITVHQQGRLRWTPPNEDGYIIIEQNTRWGLRFLQAAPGFAVRANFVVEE